MITSNKRKHFLAWLGAALLLALAWALPASGLLNPYVVQILMYVGINMILTLSLNLVNGYMGEFSVGHAGFMAIGAYVAAILGVWYMPRELSPWVFPFLLIAGGLAAALAGLVVAFPSFRTRGDYLAIVTLAFNMIVKSVLENLDVVGGPRGFKDISLLTNFPWVVFWVLVTFYLLRNLVYSNFGRGITAIREDEVAANLTSVDTRRLKVYAFCISAFFAGVAGGLFAHLLQFINPRSFSILKSTDMLVMVYLGGMGSLTGSLLGATLFTLVLEFLRPLGLWRWVIGPLLLVLLMIFRPQGIMGFKDPRWLKPADEEFYGGGGQGSQTPAPSPQDHHGRSMAPLLQVTELSHNFGGLCAVTDFSLNVSEGELVGLIGPNGAGKTTIFNLITGVFRVSQGCIFFKGQDITEWLSHRITAAGIARTFQNIRLFKDLDALDNVRLGAFARHGYSLGEAFSRRRTFRGEEGRWLRRAYELLERFNLEQYAQTPARHLPYGEQRRLEMARALISGPQLLLLDEPAAGMNEAEVDGLIHLVRELKEEFSLTILLIEHKMRVVANLCQRVTVLDFGLTLAEGPPQEIQRHPKVLEAYLGKEGSLDE